MFQTVDTDILNQKSFPSERGKYGTWTHRDLKILWIALEKKKTLSVLMFPYSLRQWPHRCSYWGTWSALFFRVVEKQDSSSWGYLSDDPWPLPVLDPQNLSWWNHINVTVLLRPPADQDFTQSYLRELRDLRQFFKTLALRLLIRIIKWRCVLSSVILR